MGKETTYGKACTVLDGFSGDQREGFGRLRHRDCSVLDHSASDMPTSCEEHS